MELKRIPVILDCDPGHDDAIAMLMAFASPLLDVRAVTTVGGNQTIEKTTNNALRILTLIGRDTPVARGADKPLVRDLEIAPSVHGESGLDGPKLPDPDRLPSKLSAVELMAQCLRECDEKLALIPTGPLTNIAVLLLAYPELKEKIARISLMGGAAIGGNWTGAAEFNILVDPEAADIVFRSGIPITMAGLDVTHKAMVYPEDIEAIRKEKGRVAGLIAGLLDFFIQYHRRSGWNCAPMHDPCAVAWLLRPDIFTSKKLAVRIDLKGDHTTGCTVTDTRAVMGWEKNIDVLFDVDRKAFVDLLLETVRSYAREDRRF